LSNVLGFIGKKQNSFLASDSAEDFLVVFKGNIENGEELKKWLAEEGLLTEGEATTTKLLVQTVKYYYKGKLEETIKDVLDKVQGIFTLGVFTKQEPGKVVAVTKDSSLVIGLGDENNFIASDIISLLPYTKKCMLINSKEVCVLTPEEIKVTTISGEIASKEIFDVSWNGADKGSYEHFMLKEIEEQPAGFRTNLSGRVVNNQVKFESLTLSSEIVNRWKKIFIVACGTSYHAGLIGKGVFESLLHIPVEVEIASEFSYRGPLINKDTLVIVISQSGETADTLAALREAKSKGASVLAITNVLTSTIGRESDYSVYIWSGPEIAIASTKAFTAMLLVEYLLALYIGQIKGTVGDTQAKEIIGALFALPDLAAKILNSTEQYEKIAQKYKEHTNAFFLGRGFDWPLSLEGALKLKETSYVHAEGYPAGEFKHGSLALVTDDTFIIALCVQKNTYEKTLANVKECRARGAKVLAIALEGDKEVTQYVDDVIYLPKVNNFIAPILTVIPLQLLAYNISKARGCNVDQPRNLVKSIVIE
jgi:glucosamine--fructose-6-phosphate aminotransferase (isomerizing)